MIKVWQRFSEAISLQGSDLNVDGKQSSPSFLSSKPLSLHGTDMLKRQLTSVGFVSAHGRTRSSIQPTLPPYRHIPRPPVPRSTPASCWLWKDRAWHSIHLSAATVEHLVWRLTTSHQTSRQYQLTRLSPPVNAATSTVRQPRPPS